MGAHTTSFWRVRLYYRQDPNVWRDVGTEFATEADARAWAETKKGDPRYSWFELLKVVRTQHAAFIGHYVYGGDLR